ncbi:hypothetical protein C8R44DRAFT_798668 [Mycena epipterygia]|nr:hypothetical protein C8R44DRAFT_798668 [Mycena epipterygia]
MLLLPPFLASSFGRGGSEPYSRFLAMLLFAARRGSVLAHCIACIFPLIRLSTLRRCLSDPRRVCRREAAVSGSYLLAAFPRFIARVR